jgi:hypothetical protein
MAAYQELTVEAINGVGTHPQRLDLYQVVLEANQGFGSVSTNLTLMFRTKEALSLLTMMQAKPPNRSGQ